MAKVKRELVIDGNMDFHDVVAFSTESCVGVWDNNTAEFIITRNGVFSLSAFETIRISLKHIETLQELDDEVYDMIEEHIKEVFDTGNVQFEFVGEE